MFVPAWFGQNWDARNSWHLRRQAAGLELAPAVAVPVIGDTDSIIRSSAARLQGFSVVEIGSSPFYARRQFAKGKT
jgi:hypothetical protein